MADPKTADGWVSKGIEYFNSKKYELALAAWNEALKMNPTSEIAWINKGLTLYYLGRKEEAIAATDEALKISPKNVQALINKSSFLNYLERYEEAIATCDTALDLDPKNVKIMSTKGGILSSWGKYEDAIAICDKALNIDPKHVTAWNNKGLSLHSMGKKEEEAFAAYSTALESDPKNAIIWLNKGSVLHDLGKIKEAIESYNEALNLDPKFVNALCAKSTSLCRIEKYEEVIATCDEALKINPNSATALNNKGFALNNMGKYEAAIVVCDEALKISPEYANFWFNKGFALKNLQKFDSALICYDTALKHNPQHKLAKENKEALLELMKSPEYKLKERVEKRERSELLLYQKGDLLDDSYLRDKYEENELRLLGKGTFGKVFLAVKKQGGERVALKVIEAQDKDSITNALKEIVNIEIIKGHQNIITYHDFTLNPAVLENRAFINQLFLEMPIADCNLGKLLQGNIGFPEQEVIFILCQISSGLLYAHERFVAHLDLKPENILISGGTVMIADWGSSLRLRSPNSTIFQPEIAITWDYNAPELLEYGEEDKYNFFLCDIYSLAMLMFRVCGIPRRTIGSINKGMKKWHDNFLEEEIFKVLERTYSAELLDLLRKMSAFAPKERIPLKDILKIYGKK